MNDLQANYPFKFHWLNDQGQPTTVFARKGSFDGETLKLEDAEIPVVVIVQSLVRDNRMVLSVYTGGEQGVDHLLIQPASKKVADELKMRLDLARSVVWAQQHRETLEKKGLGHTYREEECPVCTATLILSEMPKSPQLFCHFCDSLTTIDPTLEPVPTEKNLRICEECGMYSKPQKFTIFYFYFLLVVYGWWSKSTWRCPACMRGEAWKMLFGNLLFVLGVPVALVQLSRCYFGDAVGGAFKGLDTGNIRARKGNIVGALELYRNILDRVPNSAGVKYNLGAALLQQGDEKRALETFELALDDCSNYAPAYQQLRALYAKLGEDAKLAELERIWSNGDDDAENPELDALATE